MHRLSTRIALVALAGLMAAPPAFAAPNSNTGNTNKPPSGPIDCTLPVNAKLPFCIDLLKNKGPSQGAGMNNGSGPTNGKGPTYGSNPPGPNGNGPNNYKGPKPGSFNWNQQDRSRFHQQFNFGSFGNFSFFFAPNFSISIGVSVPHTYRTHLKLVPRSIYSDYPWFRGYYYFVDKRGDFVIVSPRSYHIVAVL
jgi:hypothetical protein